VRGFFFFSSRRRHTRFSRDWSSDVCSSDLAATVRAALQGNCQRLAGVARMDVTAAALQGHRHQKGADTFQVKVQGNVAFRGQGRSEERRVGKECRARWGAGREKEARLDTDA